MSEKLNKVQIVLDKKFIPSKDWSDNKFFQKSKQELFGLSLNDLHILRHDYKEFKKFFKKIEWEMFLVPCFNREEFINKNLKL